MDAQWELRPAALVGSRTSQRDFKIVKRRTQTQFTVTMSWSERRDDLEQQEFCRDEIFRMVREIAEQEALAIRR